MRLSERLQWTFATLFVLGGVALLLLGGEKADPAIARLIAGVATLFLGGFALCLAWNAWETGAVNVQHFRYSRASEPLRFAATVVMILLAGCVTIVAACWFLFLK